MMKKDRQKKGLNPAERSEDHVGGESSVKCWDVRLPRLSHTASTTTANMTSRAGASVSLPATPSLSLSAPSHYPLHPPLLRSSLSVSPHIIAF